MSDRIRPLCLIFGIALIAGAIEAELWWWGLVLALVGGALVGIWEAWFKENVHP